MKKQLLLGLMAIITGFTACKKDLASLPGVTPDKAKQKTNVVLYYTQELILQPRAPGAVTDTYIGFYGGVKLLFTGTPVWNINEFPTPAVGMPVIGLSVSVAPGENGTMGAPTTPPQTTSIYDNAFAVAAPAIGVFNFHAFFGDFLQYLAALDVFESNADIGTRPNMGDFVGSNYSTSPSIQVTVGKLIWINTGSHVAIAEVRYPYPQSTIITPPIGNYIGTIADPNNPNVEYMLYGLNGMVTRMKVRGIVNSDKSETGTYTTTSNPFVNVVTATIVRPDGTSFTWSGTTYDLS
jgi:hypothetical protein